MTKQLDLDRGVKIRKHPTGASVFMYKDQPGVYYNAFGRVVPDKFARAAGFDTETLGRERLRRERIEVAAQTINKEFQAAQGNREVVAERAGFKMVKLPMGRFEVVSPEGDKVHDKYLTRREADSVLDAMAGPEPQEGQDSPEGSEEGSEDPKPEAKK